jgi:beta-lactam-binding protein with PASTA domain
MTSQYQSREPEPSRLLCVIAAVIASAVTFVGLHLLDAHGVFDIARSGTSDVPNVVGLATGQARDLLKGRGLLLSIAEERDDAAHAAGVIIAQNPMAGSEAATSGTVAVVVARPMSTVLVPPLAGQTAEDATRALVAKGLVPGPPEAQPSPTVAGGTVIQTKPAEGSAVAPGSTVTLVVAAATKPVPNVVGKGLSGGKKLIEEAGFKVGAVKYQYDPCCDEYIILEQHPEAGAAAAPATVVDLVADEPG